MTWTQSGFGERLESALSSKGLTQKKFAVEILKIKEATLSGWKERSEPSYDDVLKLARGLAVRPAWLMFDDSFEPMDDEERDMLATYRKLTSDERAALRSLLVAMASQRQATKKPGKRTPREPLITMLEERQRGASLSHADQELLSRLPLLSEAQKSEAVLLEHLSVLPVGTKAWNACEAASIQLRRLISALQSSQQKARHKGSSAERPVATPASAKSQPDHVPSEMPLPFPPPEQSP